MCGIADDGHLGEDYGSLIRGTDMDVNCEHCVAAIEHAARFMVVSEDKYESGTGMQSHDANTRIVNRFTSLQPIRLRRVVFTSGRPAGYGGVFEDDSPRESSGNPEDEKCNYGYWITIYLLPDGYLKGYGIDGLNVVTLHGGVIACIMPWTSIDYIEVFDRSGWDGEIPECLRKLAEQSEKPIQSQKSKDADDCKSGEKENAKVSVWWWNPNTGVKCWVNVSGGHHTPTRPASGKERHCVIVDGVEYYR